MIFFIHVNGEACRILGEKIEEPANRSIIGGWILFLGTYLSFSKQRVHNFTLKLQLIHIREPLIYLLCNNFETK